MTSFLSRYSTPFVTGLFLVSLISGVALFFHFGSTVFHGMHEWLSMVLIVPFVLHIWKNWRPFVAYFKRIPMAVALVVSLAGGVVFALPSLMGTEQAMPPQRAMFEAMSKSSLNNIAPLFGHDGQSLMAALADDGLVITGPENTVSAIGKNSGTSTFDVIGKIAAVKR